MIWKVYTRAKLGESTKKKKKKKKKEKKKKKKHTEKNYKKQRNQCVFWKKRVVKCIRKIRLI